MDREIARLNKKYPQIRGYIAVKVQQAVHLHRCMLRTNNDVWPEWYIDDYHCDFLGLQRLFTLDCEKPPYCPEAQACEFCLFWAHQGDAVLHRRSGTASK